MLYTLSHWNAVGEGRVGVVLPSYVETERLFLRFLQTQAQMTSIKSILTIISLYLLFTETNRTGTC